MIKTTIISRNQQSWSEESPYVDVGPIDSWVKQHPAARITSCMHSGVKHLVPIYEQDGTSAPQGRASAI